MAYARRRMRRVRRNFRARARGRGRRGFTQRVRRITYGIAERKYTEFACCARTDFPAGGMEPPYLKPGTNFTGGFVRVEPYFFCPLNAIQQGVGNDQRIGSKIFVRYLQVNVRINYDPPDSPNMNVNGCICRYMVVHDRNFGANPAMPSGMLGYQVLTQPGTPDNYVHMQRGIFGLGRYKVLVDKQHVMSYPSPNTGTGVAVIQHYIPIFKQYELRTQGSSLLDPRPFIKTNLLVVAMSNHNDMCTVAFDVRVCFTDA